MKKHYYRAKLVLQLQVAKKHDKIDSINKEYRLK